ncbi:MAG: DUF1778 domain-containing protein [Bacteroidales bacterium]
MEKRKQEPGITLRPSPEERALITMVAKADGKRSLANYCMKATMEAANAFRKEHPELFAKS